jgi:hypothetical protein
MSLKNASTVVPVLILTLGFLTTSAVASTAGHDGRQRHARRAHPMVRQMDRHARHDAAPHAGYAAGARSPSDFGYVFVPGRGILGEDCNMPTSTCPNEMRDTQ